MSYPADVLVRRQTTMRSSTPYTNNDDPIRLREQIQELERNNSKLRLENEEIKFELKETRKELEELGIENNELYKTLQDKEVIQNKMREQLNLVTKTSVILYEKFRAFKCRYYEENAWAAGCAGERHERPS